jgi:hypothetical protein
MCTFVFLSTQAPSIQPARARDRWRNYHSLFHTPGPVISDGILAVSSSATPTVVGTSVGTTPKGPDDDLQAKLGTPCGMIPKNSAEKIQHTQQWYFFRQFLADNQKE